MIIDDRGRFESYIAKKLGGNDLSITSINQIEMGLSRENFFLSFECTKEGVPVKKELVVRRQPVAHFLGSYDLSVEFRVLDALQDKGISIPKTYWYEPDKNLLERPFYVMEKVREHIDLDVSAVLRGELTLDEAGDKLMDVTIRTCNGRLTATEALGHREFIFTKLYISA